jgi:hypothetical protein
VLQSNGAGGDDAAASTSAAAGGAADVYSDDESAQCGALYRGLVFFLGREVPREALLLVIRCAQRAHLRWAPASARLLPLTAGQGTAPEKSAALILRTMCAGQLAAWHSCQSAGRLLSPCCGLADLIACLMLIWAVQVLWRDCGLGWRGLPHPGIQ